MSGSRHLRARYRRILGFFARLIAQLWFFDAVLPRLGLHRLSERGRERRLRKAAVGFHDLAADLGGLMIKVGQFMSTRLDVLPPTVTDELSGLQDEAPPVPYEQVLPAAEAALGMPLSEAFEYFEPEPLAAASLGQVHRARLTRSEARDVGFRDVVVKVQRPGIEQVTDVDLAALRRAAGWIAHYRPIAERADMPALVEEFARTTAEELDYLNEAGNAERFAESFADAPQVGYPLVVWERTSPRVLTLSDVTAIKISDVEAIEAAGIDRREVAFAVADAYIEQVFNLGFFHADPHPGNLFITPLPRAQAAEAGRSWRLTFVDFGMMGQVPDNLRDELKEVVVAVGLRDSHRLLGCMQDLDMLLPSADLALIERAVSQLFDRFGGMSLADMRTVDPKEFVAFGMQFRDLMATMPFQLPQNFLLLIRAASLMNGLCVELYPEYNLWDSVEPYARSLVTGTPGSQLGVALEESRSMASLAVGLPRRIDRVLTMVERGQLSVQTPDAVRQIRRAEQGQDRTVAAVVFAGMLVGGIVLRGSEPVWGLTLMGLSLLPLGKALLGGRGPWAR
ncbi:Protein kinase-like domain [Propionibacterium ruminifibrarum]|uniref:Protein kinase-like domain n=1 Tax=Propionibacterium ruminifibrarum TaxID=1962131 RepID=A0A375I413_9ACTN|nr:AarF/UbiB family protein [Propionibacterium ruminifibrarum]SPF69454.1 Protein kinase-like domain [Propionibacterium ruminifibrarum]